MGLYVRNVELLPSNIAIRAIPLELENLSTFLRLLRGAICC